MRKHPSDSEIIRAALARGDEPAARATREHLEAGCARCRRRMEEMAAVIAALAAPPLAQAPDEVVAKASAWLSEQARTAAARGPLDQAGRRIRQALEEVRAVLVLDTAPGAALAGIRGPADARGRRLLYESPAGSLHLAIEPVSAGRIAIQGQFLPSSADPGPSTGQAVLARTPRPGVCPLSESGEFHFDDEAAGEVRLQIEWGGRRIVIDPPDASGT